MTQQNQTTVKAEQTKRAYEAPQMTDLGSVEKMTQLQVKDKGGSNCVILVA